MDITLSLITVNFNGLTDTCALIDSIPSSNIPLEVIVVDNGSYNNEAATLSQRYPSVNVVRSERNLGFAGGNNLGIKAAKGKYLFLINNDTVFDRNGDPFQPLIERLESDKKIGMVCPKIRFTWDKSPIQFAGYTPLSPITLRNHAIGFGEEDTGQHNTPHPTPYAHGAAMLLKREVIEKAGLIPECYFLYYEELDWSLCITRAGYKIWYEPAATIFHKESRATGQDSPLKAYYISRNRLLFAKRNISTSTRFLSYGYQILAVATRDTARYLLKGQTAQAKAVCRGIADFIKMK